MYKLSARRYPDVIQSDKGFQSFGLKRLRVFTLGYH